MAGVKGKSIHNGVKKVNGAGKGPAINVRGHLSETYSDTIVLGKARGKGQKA